VIALAINPLPGITRGFLLMTPFPRLCLAMSDTHTIQALLEFSRSITTNTKCDVAINQARRNSTAA